MAAFSMNFTVYDNQLCLHCLSYIVREYQCDINVYISDTESGFDSHYDQANYYFQSWKSIYMLEILKPYNTDYAKTMD